MSFELDEETTGAQTGAETQQTKPGAGLSFAAAAGAMSAHMGIESNIKEFAEHMSSFVNTAGLANAKVAVVKKGTEGIFYTNIILLLEDKATGVATYQTFLMANTGVAQMRATEVVEHYKNPGKKGPLVLPALSIENNLRATLENEIRKRQLIGDNVKLISADGLRIVETNLDETFAAKVAMNSLKYQSALMNTLNGSYDDTALFDALTHFDTVRVDISSIADGGMDFMGETRFTNWTSKSTGVSAGAIDYNRGGDEMPIAVDAGNVTLVIAAKGGQRTSKNDSGLIAVPVITINTIDLTVPSLGSVLFAIYQASILAAGDRWIKPLVDGMRDANGSVVPGRDPGILEKYINSLELDKPQAVSLAKEKDEAAVYAHIKNMCAPSPVIALENVLYGMASSETSLFTIASDPSSADRVAASKKIIEAVNKITGGRFPLDYNPDLIFQAAKISLPTGTFVAKNGALKSIDEIDTTFIATADNGDGLLEKFIHLETTAGQFYNKTAFLAELETKTRRKFYIDGEKVKMILSDTFVSTLFAAMNATGIRLDATDAPTVTTRNEFIPMSQLGSGLSPELLNSQVGSSQLGLNAGFNVGNLTSMTGGLV